MKILVIQLRRIGDIILTTPSVRALKKALPEAVIDYLCEPMGKMVLEGNPYLNELLIYDKKKAFRHLLDVRKRKYDVIIDLIGHPRSAWITAFSQAQWKVGYKRLGRSLAYNYVIPYKKEPEYGAKVKLRLIHSWLEKIGRPAPKKPSLIPYIELTRNDEAFAKSWMDRENLGKGTFVIFVPVHRHKIRQWRLEGFRKLALKLQKENGLKVYVAWGPGEEEIVNRLRSDVEKEIGLLPSTQVKEMAEIMKNAKFVVTNDSGAMHTAVAMGTSTVTVYGPTRPIDWNPSLSGGENQHLHKAVTAPDVACLGCHLSQCPHKHVCMTHLSMEMVHETCADFL